MFAPHNIAQQNPGQVTNPEVSDFMGPPNPAANQMAPNTFDLLMDSDLQSEQSDLPFYNLLESNARMAANNQANAQLANTNVQPENAQMENIENNNNAAKPDNSSDRYDMLRDMLNTEGQSGADGFKG